MGNDVISIFGVSDGTVGFDDAQIPSRLEADARLTYMLCSFPYVFFLYGKRLRGNSRFAST